jgi:RNA polymerase sigma factor (sigma-70 family)
MILKYKFRDGSQFSVEIGGELQAQYCAMCGIKPENTPEILEVSEDAYHKREGQKHYRRHKYTGVCVSLEKAEDIPDGRDAYAEIEINDAVSRALETLTPLQRTCFVEVRLNGFTEKEIAEKLDTTQQNINRHIQAALKKLYEILGDRL